MENNRYVERVVCVCVCVEREIENAVLRCSIQSISDQFCLVEFISFLISCVLSISVLCISFHF